MEPSIKTLDKKANYLLLAGIIILVLSWIIDYFLASVSGLSVYQKGFTPTPRAIVLHLLLFALQLSILVAAYFIFKKHIKMERLLAASILETKEEKARSKAIIAAIGDGISILDTNLRIIYQNKVHMEMVGGEYAGSYCYKVYDGVDVVCPECPVVKTFQDGLIQKSEKQVRYRHNVSDIEITASPLRNAAGEIIAGIEVVRDISKRKSAEEKLEKRTAAMEASIDGIAILNGEGVYIYMNQAHARLYGYDTAEKLLGKSWRIFYDEMEIRRFESDIVPQVAQKGKWRGEAVGKRIDGSSFRQEVSLTSIDDLDIICVIRDITERAQAEEEVKKLNNNLQQRASALAITNRELEAFGYSLSHDLRTPLTQIYSATQTLQDLYSARFDETGAFLLNTIGKASEHMEELIQAMLVLSQVTRSEMHFELTDISKLVQEISVELKMSDPQRQAEFNITPGLLVRGDVKLLRVALRNLLDNAWKFTSSVSPVHIEFGVIDNHGRTFFIRDNGIGFDMKDADKLFQPFQRLPGAQKFFGTGIGLATVQRVIQRHGGDIWSEGAPGKGAVFFFTLNEA